MTTEKMLEISKKHLKTAILLGVLLGAFSFLILVATQKNFRSSTDVLVSTSQSGAVDYYNLSQSSNYLTSILSQSIYSEKFLEDVEASGKVSGSVVSGSSLQRLKAWQKLVKVKTNPNVGIMTVEVFGNTQYQADQLSQAVLDVLANQNAFFLGQAQNVDVRTLSGPITEKNPSFAQIILAALGGFVVGSALFLLFVIYREEFFGGKDETKKTVLSGKIEIAPREPEAPALPKENNGMIPEKRSEKEYSITDEDYLSATSDYWKQRLEMDRR